jgi:tetratricopeptide (TPR) repeat protein
MQRSLTEYASEVEDRHGGECRFRVGLNTGPVVVGTVTDDLRMDFTAIGDTVNLAARMEHAADPGGVLVSEDTHRVVGDFFDFGAVGEFAVKGKAEAVRAWPVLRERPMRTRFEVATELGLSPLVGRDRELAALEGYVDLARGGTGQVVVVSGEAGIGKSRLILELRRRLAGEPMGWVEGHCVSFGGSTAYLPLIEALKQAFGIDEADDETRIVGRVDDAVSRWDEPARRAGPYLKYLLSVDPGDDAVTGMDPQERRPGVFDALRALLLQESARLPLVVVVDDLQWADSMTLEALGALIDIVPSAPVLLILSHRPGFSHALRERAGITRLALSPLGVDESAALTRSVLEVASLPPELERLITNKAEGNPFYVEEVSRALVESGVVARSNGSYRLDRPVEEVRIPDTIQEVILSRIDRLEQQARSAMQLASVIGREFTARILDRISELESQLSKVLGDLTALELIYEKAFFPELAYMFKHALTHDVAYATLLAERRRALHRLVGAAIEELYGERLAEHYETLAHHYSEGQDWDKALDYLEKAGDKAAAAYANAAALGFYARALDLCERVGDHGVAASASLAGKRGFVNFIIGDVPGAISDFDRLVDAGQRLGSRSLEGTALSYRGFMEVFVTDWDRAEATLRAALAIVEEGCEDVRPVANLGLVALMFSSNRVPEAEPLLITAEQAAALPDPFLAGTWNWILGFFEYWRGHPERALRVIRALPEAAGQLVSNRLYAWWVESLALASTGEYDAALRFLQEMQATCDRVGDPLIGPRILNTVGWIYGELEDHERALEQNRASAEMASQPGFPNPDVAMHARVNLGDNLIALGRPAEAEEQFRIAEAFARSTVPADCWMAWRYSQHLFHSYGELWLSRGDTARALAYADECLEVAEFNSSMKNVVKGRRLRGQVLQAQGLVDEAEQELAAALEVAIEVGNPPQLWKTHAAIGDLCRAQGRTRDARRAYGKAFSVIEGVASSLTDARLRETFVRSKHVEGIRRAAEPHP